MTDGSDGIKYPSSWFNRNVIGMSLSSLFSDMSHEMATAVLPFFIMFAIGGNAAIVGLCYAFTRRVGELGNCST